MIANPRRLRPLTWGSLAWIVVWAQLLVMIYLFASFAPERRHVLDYVTGEAGVALSGLVTFLAAVNITVVAGLWLVSRSQRKEKSPRLRAVLVLTALALLLPLLAVFRLASEATSVASPAVRAWELDQDGSYRELSADADSTSGRAAADVVAALESP